MKIKSILTSCKSAINRVIEARKKPAEISAKTHNWKTSLVLLLLVIPMSFYFWFGYQHLGNFETADEYRWLSAQDSRIPTYWTAMLAHDWKHTQINDKPGITTAIVSGLGMWYVDMYNLPARFVEQGKNSIIFNPAAVEIINSAFRLPLLAINGLLAVLWYFMLRRLFDDNWISLLACSLILLSPTLIGISQIVNPDSLLWSTSFTAVIAFLLFLKGRKWYDVMIAGLFLGFALLSKYTTVVIIPYWFGLTITYLLFQYDDFIQEGTFRKRVIQFMLGYPLAVAIGILVYALLFPAVFLAPEKLLLNGNDAFHEIFPYIKMVAIIVGIILADAIILKSWIFKKILFPFKYLWTTGSRTIFGVILIGFSAVLLNWTKSNLWGIPNIPFDAGNDKSFGSLELIHQLFLEIKPLVFSLTPIVLVLLITSLAIYIFKKNTKHPFQIFALSVLMIIFYAAVIKEGYLVHIRYSLMVYPLIMTIAAVGIMEIIPPIRWRAIISGGILLGIIYMSIGSIQKIYPFYFNYTNDLLPKDMIIANAWGYGGYEAAQYIKSQTDQPENLVVWTDYDGFCPFFAGTCAKDSDIKWIGYKTTNRISYYVVTSRGSSKLSSTWEKMKQNIASEPDWQLDIDGRPDNSIKVFRVKQSGFTSDNWWRKNN